MKTLLDYLRCPNKKCDEESLEIYNPIELSVENALRCKSCQMEYPIVDGVPIMFPDFERCNFAINQRLQEKQLVKVAEANRRCVFEERENYKDSLNEAVDSMAWEYYFWKNWEGSGKELGFLQFNRDRIDEFLKNDKQGGGHLRFLEFVEKEENDLNDKVILNIGCGRDFLFELFRDRGAMVIEQDIVLDSVLNLTKRGAMGICCDIRHLPFKSGSLDIVTSFGVYHHVWPLEIPIGETYRVIKKNGAIYLNEPSSLAINHLMKNLIPKFLLKPIKTMLAKKSLIPISPSPYEKSINPFWFRSIFIQRHNLNNIKMGFPKGIDGNIPKSMRGFVGLLLCIAPFFSSHFEMVIKKGSQGRT